MKVAISPVVSVCQIQSPLLLRQEKLWIPSHSHAGRATPIKSGEASPELALWLANGLKAISGGRARLVMLGFSIAERSSRGLCRRGNERKR